MIFILKSTKPIIIAFFMSIWAGIYGAIITINKFGIFHEETLFVPLFFMAIFYLTYILRAFFYTYKINHSLLTIYVLGKEIKNVKMNEIHIFDLGIKKQKLYHIVFLIDNKKYLMICEKDEYLEFKKLCKNINIDLLSEEFLAIYSQKIIK